MFKDEQLQNYFEGCLWYEGLTPTEEFHEDTSNRYEKENANIIPYYEKKIGYKKS